MGEGGVGRGGDGGDVGEGDGGGEGGMVVMWGRGMVVMWGRGMVVGCGGFSCMCTMRSVGDGWWEEGVWGVGGLHVCVPTSCGLLMQSISWEIFTSTVHFCALRFLFM